MSSPASRRGAPKPRDDRHRRYNAAHPAFHCRLEPVEAEAVAAAGGLAAFVRAHLDAPTAADMEALRADLAAAVAEANACARELKRTRRALADAQAQAGDARTAAQEADAQAAQARQEGYAAGVRVGIAEKARRADERQAAGEVAAERRAFARTVATLCRERWGALNWDAVVAQAHERGALFEVGAALRDSLGRHAFSAALRRSCEHR